MATGGILKNVTVPTRVLLAGVGITVLFVLATFLWILPMAERSLMEKRKEALKANTEAAWGVLGHFESLVREGRMTTAEAQSNAAAVIRNMRYGPDMKDYFWINDMAPLMIMHPYRRDLEGKDLSTLKDKNGLAFVVEFARVARKDGEGFVTYWWQIQDNETEVAEKVSYVRLFRPWNWVIGTGVYVTDVEREIRGWRIRVGVICGMIMLLGVVVSWLMGRQVGQSLREAAGDRGGDDEAGTSKDTAIRLQAFILLIIVPTLLLVTAFWSHSVYRELRTIILDGFDRKLVSISRTTGAFISGEEHAEIGRQTNEAHPLYVKYITPMRAIAKKANLSYLYTQVLANKPKCLYVLDATEGEEHTAIGTEDELPMEDYRGGERVMDYGVVHVGEVQPTENWGLLKVSYAPIYNRDDTIQAMAGADVNISIIGDKMRTALFAVALIGVGALIIAVYVSVGFARQFTVPVDTLKDSALIVAAGNYDHPIHVKDPDELRTLGEAFSRIGLNLDATLRTLSQADREMEERKRRHDLEVALDKAPTGADDRRDRRCAFAWLFAEAERKSSSGWIPCADGAVIWLAAPSPERSPLDALRLRSDIGVLISRLAVLSGGRAAAVIERLGAMPPRDLRCVLAWSAYGGTVHWIAREPVTVSAVSAGTATERIVLSGTGHRNVGKATWWVCEDDACLSKPWMAVAAAQDRPAEAEALLLALQQEALGEPGTAQTLIGVLHGGGKAS